MHEIFDLMDRAVCEFLHITVDQLNYIDERSTIEELHEMTDPVFDQEATISDVKRAIQIRDKYLKQNGLWVELAPQTSAK